MMGSPTPCANSRRTKRSRSAGTDNTGTPYAYYTRNYHVRLVPVPNVTGTLSMPYYARPNKLVQPSEAVTIAAASNAGSAWTFQFLGTPPAALEAGLRQVDVVRGTPGFETLVENTRCLVTEVAPSNYTYELSSNATIAEGDYICVPGQAPVPQVPVEMHGLLAVRAARRLVKATGDARWQDLNADVVELEDKAKSWLSPRVAGDTQQAGGSIGFAALMPFGWPGF
jgi:hypothetical protein